MKNSKKTLSIFLSLILMVFLIAILSLSGCKSAVTTEATAATTAAEATAATTATETQAQEIFKIGFISLTMGQPVPAAFNKGLETEFKDFQNIQYQAFDGQQKTETQMTLMQNLIDQHYNAIILQPVDSQALSSAVTDAEAAGIPVITIGIDVPAKHTGLVQMVTYVGGQMIAKEMAKELGEKGNVVVIQGSPGVLAGEEREQGFYDEMKKYPNIKIIAKQPANWNKDTAMTVMNNFLQAYPEINGVYCINDFMGEGAALAAEAAGRKMVIWGFDGEKDTLTMIEKGQMTGTIYTNAYDLAGTAGRLAMYLITSGIKIETIPETGIINMVPILVTKDNVNLISPNIRW